MIVTKSLLDNYNKDNKDNKNNKVTDYTSYCSCRQFPEKTLSVTNINGKTIKVCRHCNKTKSTYLLDSDIVIIYHQSYNNMIDYNNSY